MSCMKKEEKRNGEKHVESWRGGAKDKMNKREGLPCVSMCVWMINSKRKAWDEGMNEERAEMEWEEVSVQLQAGHEQEKLLCWSHCGSTSPIFYRYCCLLHVVSLTWSYLFCFSIKVSYVRDRASVGLFLCLLSGLHQTHHPHTVTLRL